MLELYKKEMKTNFTVNDTVVNVYAGKSTYEKQSIIDAALKNAYNENTQRIDRMLYDSTFYALIVLKYTDINIKDMESMQICDLYDLLESYGIIEKTLEGIKEINPSEVKELISYADLAYEEFKTTINSAGAAIQTLTASVIQMSASLVAASKTVENNK